MTITSQVPSNLHPNGATPFLPIQVISLQVDSVTSFALYVMNPPHETPVLYRAENLPFTEDVRERLADHGITHLYIRSKDESAYHRYMERNLYTILTRDDLDIHVKSVILYGSAQNLVREIMQDPRSSEGMRRSMDLVQTTVNYLFTEQTAFEHLLKVTSFDYYTYTHSVNTFVFAISLAQRAGIVNLDALRELGDGVLLHDVGKSKLDPSIINCTGKLTRSQWASMKLHPVYGFEILNRHGCFSHKTLDIVRHHHEKLGGGGYPDRLQAGQICEWVRICTICDIFDALTSQRSYKPALSTYPALTLMKDEIAHDLDRDLFRAFVEMMGHPGEPPKSESPAQARSPSTV